MPRHTRPLFQARNRRRAGSASRTPTTRSGRSGRDCARLLRSYSSAPSGSLRIGRTDRRRRSSVPWRRRGWRRWRPPCRLRSARTLIFALATIPAFIIIEVLLPLADGFAMFALAVAPMLFLCAFLMAHKKTMLIGYLSALLFASAGLFQNRMVYDPVGMLNTCIAAVVAAATAIILWAIIAPATPEAARRRFIRAARRALERIAAGAPAYRACRIRDRDDRSSRSAAEPTSTGPAQ